MTAKPLMLDLEDDHTTESEWSPQSLWRESAIRKTMQSCLKNSTAITAASPKIAQVAESLTSKPVDVFLNTYRLHEAPSDLTPLPPIDSTHPAKLVWFSQTIGPGRGLEEAITIIARMKTPSELHLVGFAQTDFLDSLMASARTLKIQARIIIHPPAKPHELVSLCGTYHLGLSLEKNRPQNRNICLTNKLFAYILAGTPVWLSDTDAQTEIAQDLGAAACLTCVENTEQVAEKLDRFLSTDFEHAREHAWHLGQQRYHWEFDQARWLALVKQTTHHMS
jgi:hypothetical protein